MPPSTRDFGSGVYFIHVYMTGLHWSYTMDTMYNEQVLTHVASAIIALCLSTETHLNRSSWLTTVTEEYKIQT